VARWWVQLMVCRNSSCLKTALLWAACSTVLVPNMGSRCPPLCGVAAGKRVQLCQLCVFLHIALCRCVAVHLVQTCVVPLLAALNCCVGPTDCNASKNSAQFFCVCTASAMLQYCCRYQVELLTAGRAQHALP